MSNYIALLFYFFAVFVKGLRVQVNPFEMVSSGMTSENISGFLKGLLVTNQYTALLDILKYRSYDFNIIYGSACENLTIETVREIVKDFEVVDQEILLSEQCVCKAIGNWSNLKRKDIDILPVSPMSSQEFSPVLMQPQTFELVLNHALEVYTKSKPVDFYSWIQDTRTTPSEYFSSISSISSIIPKFMNGFMFFYADYTYQYMLLNCFDAEITVLIFFTNAAHNTKEFLLKMLRLAVVLKSIQSGKKFYGCSSPIEPISKITINLSRIYLYCDNFRLGPHPNEFELSVIKIIKSITVERHQPVPLRDVIEFLLDNDIDMHPDWLIALLMCNLPSKQEDIRQVMTLIAQKNPHYQTIVVISNFMIKEFRDYKGVFKEETLLKNPDMILLRPLNQRLRELRTSMLPFPTLVRQELIAGLLDSPREPQELFNDIVNEFYEKYFYYAKAVTRMMITSFTKTGEIRVVNMKKLLHKALKAFLEIPKFYTTTSIDPDDRISIIPNPILPRKYVQILVTLMVHYALLGGRIPFKIDENYFNLCLRKSTVDFLKVYDDFAPEFEFLFVKISHALDSDTWFNDSNHMFLILDSYHEIIGLPDDLVRIVNINKIAIEWMKSNFIENVAAVRTAIRNIFSFNHFHSSEIYQILFSK